MPYEELYRSIWMLCKWTCCLTIEDILSIGTYRHSTYDFSRSKWHPWGIMNPDDGHGFQKMFLITPRIGPGKTCLCNCSPSVIVLLYKYDVWAEKQKNKNSYFWVHRLAHTLYFLYYILYDSANHSLILEWWYPVCSKDLPLYRDFSKFYNCQKSKLPYTWDGVTYTH